MTKTTQCPACQTRFKVSDVQLDAANGLVRCGRCAHVFNAIDHLIAPAPAAPAPAARPAPAPVPPPPPASAPPAMPTSAGLAAQDHNDIDDFELEVPDFDPLAANLPEPSPDILPDQGAPSMADVEAFQQALNQALHQNPVASAPIGNPFADDDLPAPAPAPYPERPLDEDDIPAVLDSRRTAPAAVEPEFQPLPEEPLPEMPLSAEAAPFDPAAEPEHERKKRRNPMLTVLVLFASLLGLALLAGQLIYLNRTLISAQAPESRPVFERLCKKIGCTVPFPTDQEFIRTEWSELSFVPEHANLVQLSATLKNHANYAQAYPMLEVTLKDADNQVLIRKVFTPREYLKADSQRAKSFAAQGEEKITMRFDVGKVHAQGYSLYWFYP